MLYKFPEEVRIGLRGFQPAPPSVLRILQARVTFGILFFEYVADSPQKRDGAGPNKNPIQPCWIVSHFLMTVTAPVENFSGLTSSLGAVDDTARSSRTPFNWPPDP